MKAISDYQGGFLAGFAAGEGCFTIDKNHKNNPRTDYKCRFVINLRDDDKSILEKIHDTLEMGTIYDLPARSDGIRIRQPQAVFTIAAIKDCVELVKLFDKYPLQAKKQDDFAIWKKAVKELQKPVDCRDADLLEYYFLKIREVRKYEKQDELVKPKRIEFQLTIDF